jgi:hypothetical protein
MKRAWQNFATNEHEIRLRILSNTAKINDGVRQIKVCEFHLLPKKTDNFKQTKGSSGIGQWWSTWVGSHRCD